MTGRRITRAEWRGVQNFEPEVAPAMIYEAPLTPPPAFEDFEEFDPLGMLADLAVLQAPIQVPEPQPNGLNDLLIAAAAEMEAAGLLLGPPPAPAA